MSKKILFTVALMAMFVTASQADAFWCCKSGGNRSNGYGYGYGSNYGYGYGNSYGYAPAGYGYGNMQYAPGTMVAGTTTDSAELRSMPITDAASSPGVVTSGYYQAPGTTYIVPSGYYSSGYSNSYYPGNYGYYPSAGTSVGNGRFGASYGSGFGYGNGYYSQPYYGGYRGGSGFGVRFR